MQHSLKNRHGSRVLGFALSLALLSGSGLTGQAQNNRRTVRLEEGTVLPVVLENELTSHKSQRGDKFTARLRTEDRSYVGLPEGTLLEGVVTEAQRKGDNKTPGILDIEFRRLRMPDGQSYAITTELIPLDNKSIETRENGRLVAKPGAKKDDLKYVGYGAAAGALISILGNRGRITIENLLLGGLAGYAAGALGGGGSKEAKDVVLKSGTEVGVRLAKPIRFTTSENYIPDDDRAPYDDRDINNRDRDYRDRNDPLRNRDNRDRNDRLRDRDSAYNFAVMFGDRPVSFDADSRPFRSGDTWMLPVAAMADSYDLTPRYTQNRRTVELRNGSTRVSGRVGSDLVTVNGTQRRLDVPLRMMNGELYAPARFFEFATNTVSRFDQDSNTLVFRNGARNGARARRDLDPDFP